MRACPLAFVGVVAMASAACATRGAAALAADPKVTVPAPPSGISWLSHFSLGESSEAADEFWRLRAESWRKRYDKMDRSAARWARLVDDEMDQSPYRLSGNGPYVVPKSVRLCAMVGWGKTGLSASSDELVAWANQHDIAFRVECVDEAPPAALERVDCASTDAGMQQLGKRTSLVALSVGDTSITNAGLASLVDLKRLEALDISMADDKITDAGMAHIRKLTNLAQLVAWRTWIGDAGLRELAELPNLIDINLAVTKVTDAGILVLAKLPKLRRVRVPWTAVTEAGCQALDRAIGRHVCDRSQATWSS